jgi:predicted dehydrogenase
MTGRRKFPGRNASGAPAHGSGASALIRSALVGAGNIARAHLSALRSLPDVECVAICDRAPVMAESMAEAFGAAGWFTDFERMLREVRPDVVHVTTPPASHFALARAALESGAHVLVEKPITTRAAELDELVALARTRDRMLVENQNYLFNGTLRELVRRLEGGALGELVHVDVVLGLGVLGPGSRYAEPAAANPFAALRGGLVADFITHLCSLAVGLVGPHRRAHALWSKRNPSTPLSSDELLALIDAERGTAVLHFSARAQPDTFHVIAHGTRMRVVAGLFEPLFASERLRSGPRPLLPVRNGFALARAHARAAIGGLWRKLAGRPAAFEGLGELVRRTYDAIRDNSPPPLSLDHLVAVRRLEEELLEQEAPS